MMKAYPHDDDYVPGTWKALETQGGKSATFACPDCGLVGLLTDHEIGEDGAVNPSVACECGFHEWIKLEGWSP